MLFLCLILDREYNLFLNDTTDAYRMWLKFQNKFFCGKQTYLKVYIKNNLNILYIQTNISNCTNMQLNIFVLFFFLSLHFCMNENLFYVANVPILCLEIWIMKKKNILTRSRTAKGICLEWGNFCIMGADSLCIFSFKFQRKADTNPHIYINWILISVLLYNMPNKLSVFKWVLY